MAEAEETVFTCVAAQVDAEGLVFGVVVGQRDDEFQSTVFRLTSFGNVVTNEIFSCNEWVTDLWLSPLGYLYGVDDEGNLHTNRSGVWETISLGLGRGFTAIWGLDDQNIYITGRDGVVIRGHLGRWEDFSFGVDGHLYGVHGTAPDNIYVVGTQGRIFHFAGTQWTRAVAPTNYDFHSVFCSSVMHAFVCGDGGMFFEGSGSRWTQVSGLNASLFAICRHQDTVYVGAGGDGLFSQEKGGFRSVKDKIPAFRLHSSGNFLVTSGGNRIVRFDGKRWLAAVFS